MSGMDRWIWLVLALLVFVGYWCWFAWDQHVRYGPLIAGNARWRREAPQRDAARVAREAQREALAALTDEDKRWLESVGWKPL